MLCRATLRSSVASSTASLRSSSSQKQSSCLWKTTPSVRSTFPTEQQSIWPLKTMETVSVIGTFVKTNFNFNFFVFVCLCVCFLFFWKIINFHIIFFKKNELLFHAFFGFCILKQTNQTKPITWPGRSKHAIRLDPSNVKAYFRAAKASYALKKVAQCVEFCELGLAAEPTSAPLAAVSFLCVCLLGWWAWEQKNIIQQQY